MKAVPLSRYFLFFSLAIAGCAVDLATKTWMFRRLGPPPSPTAWVWNGVFGFQTSLNQGALFGMGQGWVPVFASLSILAAIGVFVWLFYFGAARELLLTIALACVTAGIFGNLYDRLGLPGLTKTDFGGRVEVVRIGGQGAAVYAVRDWILVMIGRWQWPNFNIADSLLVCGAAMLVWHAWRTEKPS